MKRLLRFLVPPNHWKLPVIIVLGIFTGLSLFSIHISRAPSYLSDKPKTCINCHVMTPMYQGWAHSAHREVATCNDCHVPHTNPVSHYWFKAKDGLRHATIFTMRAEPHVIQIKEASAGVVQQNCIRCHNNLLSTNKLDNYSKTHYQHRTDRRCWDCHRSTPHGRVNSLSSTPNAIAPLPKSPVPKWLKKIIQEDEQKEKQGD